MTRVLAIDTAAGACSAAVWDGVVLHERILPMQRGHAEALVPLLLDVLAEAGCGFADLGILAVTVGPGAFTGLRVGLATARGIRVATGLPCLAVTTLEAIAAAARPVIASDRTLLVALDTRRGDAYAQAFRGGEPLGAPEVVALDVLAQRFAGISPVLAGDAAGALRQAIERTDTEASVATGVPGHPTAGWVARLARDRWLADLRDPGPPAPLYLRAPSTGPRLAAAEGR